MGNKYVSNGAWYRLLRVVYLVTSIGVIIHEYAHKWFAEERGLEVIDVDYFSLEGNQLGEVRHEMPQTYRGVFAVSVAPFLVNSSIAIVCFTVAGSILSKGGMDSTPLLLPVVVGSVWGGVSTAIHAFPSSQDISNVVDVKRQIWATSTPPGATMFEKVFDSNIFVKIVLSPVWVVLKILQMLTYSIRSPLAVGTVPFLLFFRLCNRTRSWGSAFVYTIGVAALSQWYVPFVVDKLAIFG